MKRALAQAVLVSGLLLHVACGFGESPSPEGTEAIAQLPLDLDAALGDWSAWTLRVPSLAGKGRRTLAPEASALAGRSWVPELRLRVHEVVGERVAPLTRPVGRGQVLSFLPLVGARLAPGCRLVLDVAEGDATLRLWEGAPLPVRLMRRRERRVVQRLGTIGQVPQRVSVAMPETGPGARLRFRTQGPCAKGLVGLANLKLAIEPGPGQPPILFVCSDQHRFDHAFGKEGARRMPRLAAFAREAVHYPNAFSNASWTLPSIVSTLTGLRPQFHGAGRRIESLPKAEWRGPGQLAAGEFFMQWGDSVHVFHTYPRRLVSLGERLGRLGYTTIAVVANPLYIGSGLLQDGFDVVLSTGSNPAPGDLVNAAAGAALAAADPERPVFLLVHYMDVHQYRTWSGLEPSELDADALRENYALRVGEADRAFGDALELWTAHQPLERSLVAFYSDHGEHLAEPGRPRERHGDTMDEVALRIPLVVRYPEAVGKAGGVDPRPVSLVDLVPTVQELVADPFASALHGRSWLAPPAEDAVVVSDLQLSGDELSTLRMGTHKLVVNWTEGSRTLLDLERADPMRPEASWAVDSPERRAELESRFDAYVAEGRAFSRENASDHVPDHEELGDQLRALGYSE